MIFDKLINNFNENFLTEQKLTISRQNQIPYFTFGFTTHFYFPSEKLQTKMKLSEIPNPPFTLGPDCKFIYIINKI